MDSSRSPDTVAPASEQPRITVGSLQVAREWHDFIMDEALPGSGVDAQAFWQGLEQLLAELRAPNEALLARRLHLQEQINGWHLQHGRGQPPADEYRAFLEDIDYLVPAPAPFTIETTGMDPEITQVAAPQLVVPITNARYALNAANARWGSLYDALHGTDAIPEADGAERTAAYNPVRGKRVIAFVRDWLDQIAPLGQGSHAQAQRYAVDNGALVVSLQSGSSTALCDPALFVGYAGPADSPTVVLLRHHGLHVELRFDRDHPIGRDDAAGIADVQVEAALTTILDLEDSVATVDAEDKVHAYRHWLGLMKADLHTSVRKGDRLIERRLASPRVYQTPAGDGELRLPGRALLLVRNVGHLMKDSSVLDAAGQAAPEGILDGLVTALIGMHDLRRDADAAQRNTATGALYMVKPKMHGPQEVAFTVELFSRIEDILGLPRNTMKVGIMDEERRTSANLAACLYEARERLFFINTGFLDRTGDEIHTAMEAGPVVGKAAMKQEPWIAAYEASNVDVGLACGFAGRAQIGKGMWAMPDLLAAMLDEKIGHLEAGASTAWVPSPTAATLHALHYHRVDVRAQQAQIAERPPATLDDLLTLPLAQDAASWSAESVQEQLEDAVQGILGYVVRWVHMGIGCSKVPDIHNVGRMEDRATLRISSQLLANWLHHGVIDAARVEAALLRMAAIVDEQNAGDAQYVPMGPDYRDTCAFRAARDLIFEGRFQPSGYTEPLLHAYRAAFKAQQAGRSNTSG